MAESIAVMNQDQTQINYRIELRHDFLDLCGELKKLGYKKEQKLCIVTDSNVAPLYAQEVFAQLNTEFPNLFLHVFDAGEANKHLNTVSEVYETLITNHFERKDLLLALGGGVVGDLTGFTAATYLRGIDFVQIPTTLLSQVDSSIGGKTGVDFMQYKNMVGAFYQPKLVYMNLSTLKTLPQKQIVSGMGEIIKHGCIKDASYFYWLKEHHAEILSLRAEELEEMISRSCMIKRDVVEHDPKEQGERALLNFGHTIGHAIEKLSNFSLSHGECVGLGIAAASYISRKTDHISQETADVILETLEQFGLPVQIAGYDPQEVLSVTKSDKKMAGGKVKFILLQELGNAFIYKDLSDAQILDGIRAVCR